MNDKYEAVGLTHDQARDVGDLLCGGSVYFVAGHIWVNEKTIIRPIGCECEHCKEFNQNNELLL